jgi:hypothetical protein
VNSVIGLRLPDQQNFQDIEPSHCHEKERLALLPELFRWIRQKGRPSTNADRQQYGSCDKDVFIQIHFYHFVPFNLRRRKDVTKRINMDALRLTLHITTLMSAP